MGELRGELDSTARLPAIVESSHDSIISWTPGQIIATWNPESERIHGCRADEAIGQDLSLIVPPVDIAEIGRVHEQVLRGEPVQTIETLRLRRDGTVFDVAVTISPIRDATGRIAGLSAVGREITVARRAVEALRSSTEHVRRVRAKIEQDPVHPRLLQTVRGIGYRFDAASLSGTEGDASVSAYWPQVHQAREASWPDGGHPPRRGV